MRVYYISSGLQGCYYERCLLPMQANGWDGDQTSIIPHTKVPENKAWAAQNSDVVVFHRPDDPQKLELAKYLKKTYNKTIVFDNDDTYKDDGGFKLNEFMNKERMEMGMQRINEAIDEFISIADVVTCSTDFLNREYSQINANVVTLPNCIDPFMAPETEENESDVVRIGVTGSIMVTSDFDHLYPIVKHFENDPRVKFVLYSLPPRNDSKLMEQLYSEEYKMLDTLKNIEWHHFTPFHEYYDKLAEMKLDAMIIPRADTYFNRCKSNLKFLETSMVKVPTIAQSFTTHDSPYEQNPEDGKYLTLASSTEDFIAEIEKVIADRDGARQRGLDAYNYVIDTYDIEKHASKWEATYFTAYTNTNRRAK